MKVRATLCIFLEVGGNLRKNNNGGTCGVIFSDKLEIYFHIFEWGTIYVTFEVQKGRIYGHISTNATLPNFQKLRVYYSFETLSQ